MFLTETSRYRQCLLAGWKDKKLCEKKRKMPKVSLVLDINNPDVTRYGNEFNTNTGNVPQPG